MICALPSHGTVPLLALNFSHLILFALHTTSLSFALSVSVESQLLDNENSSKILFFFLSLHQYLLKHRLSVVLEISYVVRHYSKRSEPSGFYCIQVTVFTQTIQSVLFAFKLFRVAKVPTHSLG